MVAYYVRSTFGYFVQGWPMCIYPRVWAWRGAILRTYEGAAQ